MFDNNYENRKCRPVRNCQVANYGCGDDKFCQDELRYNIKADPKGPRCKPINALHSQTCCAWTHKKEIYERGVFDMKKQDAFFCGANIPYKGKAASFKRVKVFCCGDPAADPPLDIHPDKPGGWND